MTRMERRRQRRIDAVCNVCFAATILAISAVLIVWAIHSRAEAHAVESRVVYREEGRPAKVFAEIIEAPDESELIAEAVAASIGTPTEVECLGYHIEPVFRAVMGEAGGNSDHLIRQAFTCALNAAAKRNITPEEAVELYGYVKAEEYSQRVKEIGIDVLIYGNVAEDVGNATVFYNVDKQVEITGAVSNYHEQQREVLEVETRDGRVRFYEEVG